MKTTAKQARATQTSAMKTTTIRATATRTTVTRTAVMKTTLHRAAFASAMVAGCMTALFGPTPAAAQSIEDKLRTQLRTTAQQLRELQDAQAQVQSDKTTAEQQRDQALANLKATQGELEAAKGKSGAQVAAERALAAEKAGRAQDAQQLAKYKSAYEELLALSKSREAEQARLQTAQKASATQVQTCEAKNVRLYAVGHEVLDAYEHLDLATYLKSREPFAQQARVKYDQIAQDYGDQLYAARFDPNAMTPLAAGASSVQATSK
jgi:hypothetical protein